VYEYKKLVCFKCCREGSCKGYKAYVCSRMIHHRKSTLKRYRYRALNTRVVFDHIITLDSGIE
jgi:hypothetical protein